MSIRQLKTIGLLTLSCFALPVQGTARLQPDRSFEQQAQPDYDRFERKFEDLEKALQNAEDPLAEGMKFIQSILDEVEAAYGVRITLAEACQMVKDNIDQLELPPEARESVLAVIEIYLNADKDQPSSANQGRLHSHF